ncbi:hypothetical protein GP486_000120 [Trichoglossum hirsutum]|uniref:L-lactate dehydrogenase n=1 Tax=Trichoglossum hirsutum TaxID=265104 RepID=A0A9P8RU98_9PEZI|nr:hypothetical protein GP486_000120 [Trichoglossum hirsutum]
MLSTTTTIAIVGAGYVGSAIANALLLRQVARDIVLVDIDEDMCRAQVQDLSDAAFSSATRVTQGTYRDASLCDIIVIAAGIGPRFDESRLSLIDKNLGTLKQVLGAMRPLRQDAIVVVVANPVDLLTYFAQQLSGLPKCQVFGSGTSLDSVRLRAALAERLQISSSAIQANVLGEHGDSQVVAWSTATVGGSPLSNVFPFHLDDQPEIAKATKEKAFDIIKAKGHTSYGIAAVVSSICECIILDRRQVHPLSHWQESLKCCLSLPAILGRSGVLSTIPTPLSEGERALIEKSAKEMRQVVHQCAWQSPRL